MPPQRTVVSYVRRSARMNRSQAAALERLSPRYVVDVPPEDRSTTISREASVDWAAIFGAGTPLSVEIGCGMGDAFVARALAQPTIGHVAFEVYARAVAVTLMKLEEARATNARVVVADGEQGLQRLFPTAGLQAIYVLFPDPWHKKRHHKRRLVDTGFATLAADRIVAGGSLILATDWLDYAEEMRDILDANPSLANLHPGGWAPRPTDRPVTKYEARGITAGRTPVDLAYRKVT